MTVAERSCPACHTPLPEAAQFCMNCGTATPPTDPGVPPRVAATGAFEVAQVTKALAGRYKIERVVGEGGMATVYLAQDARHKRKVAVKVMRPELAATLGADRFLREVEIAAQLNHPNILAMYDSGEADGLLYYVMPFIEGETLKDRLERDGALPPEESLRLAREIAEALAYAHKRGIVHRDIKPANILLNEGHALVADFGIARAVEDVGGEALTKTGLAVGTPQYMAPEQATGERNVDGRADIYAAGAILYEMLAGQPPFTGQNARAVLTRSLTERPKPISEVREGLAPQLDTLVQKALAKATDDRYASASEFVAAIDVLRGGSSGTLPAITPPYATQAVAAPDMGKRPAWLSPRNALIAVLAVAALVFALRGRLPGRAGGDGSAPPGNRLVVLPFHNIAGQEDFYLVSGLSYDVRYRLGQVKGFRVIASGTSNQYQDSKQTPAQIARELGADYVLTAEARRSESGGQLVIASELREARSDAVRWQEKFDLSGGDIAAVPARIAQAVAGRMGVAPTAKEAEELAKLPTANADAYRAFLRGAAITASDPATLRQKIQQLEQAVALDSSFAFAWSQLSQAYSNFYFNAVNKDASTARRAKEALDRAQALDPGAIHVRRARYLYFSNVTNDQTGAVAELDGMLRDAPDDPGLLALSANGDISRSELGAALAKLERARDVDPRSGGVQNNLVTTYAALDRGADAIKAGDALVSIRPLDVTSAQTHAMAYLSAGDLEGARKALKAAVTRGIPALKMGVQMAGYFEVGFALDDADQQAVLRLTPNAFDDSRAWWTQSLATLLWQRGDTARAHAFADSALAPTRQLLVVTPDDFQMHGILALMLAYTGRASEARAELQKSVAYAGGAERTTYNLVNAAKAELALGNRDAALGYLKKVRPLGTYVTNGWIRVDPTFATLRGYPPAEEWMKATGK